MKRKTTYSGVHAFLQSLNLLEHGSPEEIANAKRIYWSNYKKQHKKAKRKECKSFEVLLNERELKIVSRAATVQQSSITHFIKRIALSNGLFTPVIVGQIREVLMVHYVYVQELLENNAVSPRVVEKLLAKMAMVEHIILKLLSGKP